VGQRKFELGCYAEKQWRCLAFLFLTISSTLPSSLELWLNIRGYTMNTPVDPVEGALEQVEVNVVPTEAEVKTEEKVSVEEFTINGHDLVAKVKELVHKGNIRRIIIKNEEGRILIEIPLTVGVVGGVLSAALFPVIAAVGVIGAMVVHLTVVIEKRA
jgi:Domain of unknown function (DUF4342)